MKYYIIAGEASGDLHASNLMKELKKLDGEADFRYWGGDLMASQGGTLVRHYRDTAYMGVWEVLINLKSIFRNLNDCREDILRYRPDVVILVDYPGFNLRIAKFAHHHGFRVFYYISPKIWAWNTRRVKRIKKWVDKMFTILPFETDFFAKHNVPVVYSGNPILDAIHNRANQNEARDTFLKRHQLTDRPIIALLPGSRKQEIERLLPEMLAITKHFPEHQFIIAGAPSFDLNYYQKFFTSGNFKVLFNETYSLLKHSSAALVTSGTATLEAALLNCPQVVCYKMWGGSITNFIAKNIIIKVPYISLVNLIAGKQVVTELFQIELTHEALIKELGKLLYDNSYRQKMLNEYDRLRKIMGKPGCSKKTAKLMWESITSDKT